MPNRDAKTKMRSSSKYPMISSSQRHNSLHRRR